MLSIFTTVPLTYGDVCYGEFEARVEVVPDEIDGWLIDGVEVMNIETGRWAPVSDGCAPAYRITSHVERHDADRVSVAISHCEDWPRQRTDREEHGTYRARAL